MRGHPMLLLYMWCDVTCAPIFPSFFFPLSLSLSTEKHVHRRSLTPLWRCTLGQVINRQIPLSLGEIIFLTPPKSNPFILGWGDKHLHTYQLRDQPALGCVVLVFAPNTRLVGISREGWVVWLVGNPVSYLYESSHSIHVWVLSLHMCEKSLLVCASLSLLACASLSPHTCG